MKKNYSTSIYTAFSGKWSDLSPLQKAEALKKRWYVRWAVRNPDTGKMDRGQNIYGGVNQLRTYKERMAVLRHNQRHLIDLLESGADPREIKHSAPSTFEAIDAIMEIKKLHMSPASYIRFKSDVNKFRAYLDRNGHGARPITAIDKKTITNYLNEVLKDVSARSRNNYRTTIGTLWQTLEDEGIVERNFVKTIPMLKSKPKRNRTYTDAQVEELFAYMEKSSPNMLLFVKFVSYNFLRPIEVCRLRVESFDFQSNTLTVRTKGEEMKIKTIPSILLKEIPMEDMKGHLFTRTGLWGDWNTSEDAKRGHFSREFRKIKDVFGLGEDYGIYSFRHYFISKLYREFRKEFSPFETKSKMMLITGHSTMAALEKYLRSIDAEMAEDYSDML